MLISSPALTLGFVPCAPLPTSLSLCLSAQAPEILQGHKYGAKADLWSVGAILFEMLAGKPPFGGANQVLTYSTILLRGA